MSQKYFTPYEVAQHNSVTDCWLSVFHDVYDLTHLIKVGFYATRQLSCMAMDEQNHSPSEVRALIENAGQDVSHWFDASTGEGRFVHVAPPEPCTTFDVSFRAPWWRDGVYRVGRLTKHPRVVRFRNVLTDQKVRMEVPEEETVREIRARYKDVNGHASSYAIKGFVPNVDGAYVLKELDLNKTLTDNGIPDEIERFEECGLASDFYIPVLLTYWMDTLTKL